MKNFQILWATITFLLLAGCEPELPDAPKLNPDSLGGQETNPNAPRYWKNNRLPLKIYISEDFETDFSGFYDPEDEKNPFEQMQQNWEAAVPDKELFTLDLDTVSNFEPNSMSGFDDNEIGIYKSYTWYDDISSGALAVTQFYAYRRNTGTPSEHLEMIHSDIVLNYRDYDFTMDESNGLDFDLPTVVNHELGHLLGLGHIDFNEAVMNSFLRKNEVKRELFSLDSKEIEDLYEDYTYSLTSGDSQLLPSFSTSGGSHPKDGERVQGMIELMADGECRHYENGELVYKHER